MKHSIVLRAAIGTQGGWLILDRIKYKGKEYMITKDHEPVEMSLRKPSDEMWRRRITPDDPYTLSYDDDVNFKDNNNQKRKLMAEMLPYHHQMITEGFQNPNSGGALLFEFDDIAMNDIRNYNVLMMIYNAANKVREMSYREKVDVMYYYGENPDGMGHRNVTIRLIDVGVGIVMRRSAFGNKGLTYLEHFVKEYKATDPMNLLKTSIVKATMIKDSEDRVLIKKEGTIYMLGDKVMGSTIEEVVNWLVNNPKIKDYLFSIVAQNDSLDVDDVDEAVQQIEEKGDFKNIAEKDDEDALRKKAKSMLVMHWHKLNLNDLKKKIEIAEPIFKKVKLYDLQGEIGRKRGATLEWVEELVKRKEGALEETA